MIFSKRFNVDMSVEVRPTQNRDEIEAAFSLVQELAAHENSIDLLEITEAAFIRAASGPNPTIHILVAIVDGSIIGTATYYERFHIWKGSQILELDDLFVSPLARGKGVGSKLLHALGALAKSKNQAVKWQVNADNTGAIALYKRMGADYRESGICFWRPENI